jgi:hypothetical protein
MTQYELIDAAGTFHGLASNSLMAYFSVLSAYLIVAYFVGSSLTRQQVLAITGLYLTVQLFTTWGTFNYFSAGRIFITMANMDERYLRPPPVHPSYIAAVLFIIGIFAGLKFMWDIRHPKTE